MPPKGLSLRRTWRATASSASSRVPSTMDTCACLPLVSCYTALQRRRAAAQSWRAQVPMMAVYVIC